MTPDEIIQKILNLRGVENSQEFFNPTHPKDSISPFDSQPAIDLINKHIELGSKIAIYGDYDVDGVCSTAILWETLYSKYKNVFPHIPHRESEGYGLSIKGIDHCLAQGAKLIITVDNGIVAFNQVDHARKQRCDVIIIDHHEQDEKLPNANVVLHSTQCCAAGLSWFFARDYQKVISNQSSVISTELVAIATVCDMVPLLGTNRSFVKFGLEELQNTKRLGLIALFEQTQIPSLRLREGRGVSYLITTYHLGFIIGPRINAMGRLEHAIDSLRLLCTQNKEQADKLAKLLNDTNISRQDETKNAVNHALGTLNENDLPDLIVVSDTGYHPGVIGLIAGKLTEKYHRPSIAISVGETESKASCRSVAGFNITEYLRGFEKLLVAVGGHAMAAGFTVSNLNLPKILKKLSNTDIDPKLLKKTQRVDLEIPLELVNLDLWLLLQRLAPFGLGNPQPIFSTSEVEVSNVKTMGKENKHLKFKTNNLDFVWFNFLKMPVENQMADVVYTIDINNYAGRSTLQLIVKELN